MKPQIDLIKSTDDINWKEFYQGLLDNNLRANNQMRGDKLISSSLMAFIHGVGRDQDAPQYLLHAILSIAGAQVGLATVHQLSDKTHLAMVYVKPTYRRHGLAKELLKVIMEHYPVVSGTPTKESARLYRSFSVNEPKGWDLLPTKIHQSVSALHIKHSFS